MNNKNADRVLYWLLVAVIVMALGAMVTAIWMVYFDTPVPIEFDNKPFPTNQKVYQSGDDVVVYVELCRYTDVPFTLSLEYRNSLVFSVPEMLRPGSHPGCYDINTSVGSIPDSLPPGMYVLHGKAVYEINFLSSRLATWETQPFTVTEKSE